MNFRTKNKGQRTTKAVIGFVLLLCPLFFAPCSANEPIYTLSAKVSETQPKDATFSAHFKHPATGENLEYLFNVTEHTGMNGLKHVKELRRDDLLQIDYFKKADGSLIVEYMARMKMEGAPDGLDQFNPADLLRSEKVRHSRAGGNLGLDPPVKPEDDRG